ncbi:LysE family translocator [Bradyrhizobium sp. RDT10]
MPDFQTFFLFLAASLLVAITPGPGIFYIVARTLVGGRTEGLASSVGLGLGGLVHVFGRAVGISALVMASAEAFTFLKIAGALYLIWLGLKTWREARIVEPTEVQTTGVRRAFRDGIIVEALNPKTAAFFLAFIPSLSTHPRTSPRSSSSSGSSRLHSTPAPIWLRPIGLRKREPALQGDRQSLPRCDRCRVPSCAHWELR